MKINKIILTTYIILILLIIFFGFRVLIKNRPGEVFSKGILVLNIDKKEYVVGETVKIQISSVDMNGKPNCEANLKLTINDIQIDKLSKSFICGNTAMGTPDYLYSFKPEKIGKYNLKLTDLDSKITATNSFEVVSKRNLDITREMPTIINPTKNNRYPVKLIINAKSDYMGEIGDTIPSGLKIVWKGLAKVTEDKISWQINLKAGETIVLTYEYSAPNIVPAIYTFKDYGEWRVIATKNTQEPVKIPNIINKLK